MKADVIAAGSVEQLQEQLRFYNMLLIAMVERHGGHVTLMPQDLLPLREKELRIISFQDPTRVELSVGPKPRQSSLSSSDSSVGKRQ